MSRLREITPCEVIFTAMLKKEPISLHQERRKRRGGTGHSEKQKSARVAHQLPGRIRLELSKSLTQDELKEIIQDLKLSPEVSDVRINGRHLIIEHDSNKSGSLLQKIFPGLEPLSNSIDEAVAKATEMPEVNKLIPAGFLGLALFKAFRDGAFFAGESAFAMAYIAFDLYWKFQQENVTGKIHEGMTKGQQENLSKAS